MKWLVRLYKSLFCMDMMDDIEIDALHKSNYERYEDALFKAAKKYIGGLAKQYSKAYVNKGSLFKNTWSEVCMDHHQGWFLVERL